MVSALILTERESSEFDDTQEIIDVGFIANLLPKQNDIIAPLRWQRVHLQREDFENPITDQFKDIIQKIGYNIREKLIAQDFAHFKIIQAHVPEITNTEDIRDEILKNEEYKLPSLVENWDDRAIVGWRELFWWCVLHKKLVGNFKIITKT